MMKIKTKWKGGRPLVILGLSHRNLDKLRADGLRGYILIDGEALGIPLDVVITAAATEQEMMRVFADGIGPETELRIDPRLKS